MRATFAVLAALLAMPASAAAAPFGELPFQPVSGGAACLRPTGAPGELMRWYEGGAEVLVVQPTGLVPVARVPLGRRIACPVVASDPSGAAVIAAATRNGVRVAVREPGGTWEKPVTLPGGGFGNVAVGVSARGDAVVVWIEPMERLRARVRVARRAPGGGFATPVTLASASAVTPIASVGAGMDAHGEALVLFTSDGTRGRDRLNVVRAAPGVPFGASRTLGAGSIDEPAMAVAPDGRALVTADGYDGLEVYERPPGGEFGPRTIVFEASANNVTVALRSGGAAVIAWQNSIGEDVIAVVRDSPAPFGAPIRVLEPPPPEFGGSETSVISIADGGPPPEPGEALRAALGADGRALLAWATDDRGLGTATVTSAGRTEIGTIGSPLREPFGPTPLVLADGSRALAWTDDHSDFSSGPLRGRLHLALEGASSPNPAEAPRVTVGRARASALRPAQPLVLRVRCSAACDLRAALDGRDNTFLTASRSRAGTVDLRFDPLFEAIAPPRPGPIRIALQSGAPGAASPQRRTVRVRLRRLPAPPLPRIEDVRIRRRGDDLEIRWRTDVRPRDAFQLVYATSTREIPRDPSPVFTYASGSGRTFRVVLRDAGRKRFVHISAVEEVGGGTRRKTIRGPFSAS